MLRSPRRALTCALSTITKLTPLDSYNLIPLFAGLVNSEIRDPNSLDFVDH